MPTNTELNIPKTFSSIPIHISQTHEQKFSAANRNIAAHQALQDPHVEGLIFFDIDDYMHPRYLEKVQQAFEDGADVFMHNYYNWPGRRVPAKEACQEIQMSNPTLYQSYFKDEFKPIGYGQITPFDENNNCIDTHNGHVSLKRFVFEREQFNEDIHFRRTEDCHYNYRLLKAGYNILASSDKLSLYFW